MLTWFWEAVAGSYPGWCMWRQGDPDDVMEKMTLSAMGMKKKKDEDEKERKRLRTAVRIR